MSQERTLSVIWLVRLKVRLLFMIWEKLLRVLLSVAICGHKSIGMFVVWNC